MADIGDDGLAVLILYVCMCKRVCVRARSYGLLFYFSSVTLRRQLHHHSTVVSRALRRLMLAVNLQ